MDCFGFYIGLFDHISLESIASPEILVLMEHPKGIEKCANLQFRFLFPEKR